MRTRDRSASGQTLRVGAGCLLLLIGACEDDVGLLNGGLVAPTTIDFGEIAIGRVATRSIEIENHGSEVVVVQSASSDTGMFRANQLPATLSPGEAGMVEIEFQPTAITDVPVTDTLTLMTTVANLSIEVSGRAVFPLSFEPAALAFDAVAVGVTRESTVRATNTTREAIELSASISGPFELAGPRDTTIPADQTLDILIRYTPSGAGADEGELVLEVCSHLRDCRAVVPITATADSALRCSPSSFFIEANVGELGEATVDCVNASNDVIFLGGAMLDANAPREATIESSSTGSLAPGETTSIVLRYQPRLSQAGQVFVGVVELDAVPPIQLPYELRAVLLPGDCSIRVEPSELDFGTVPVPTVTTRFMRIINDGTTVCIVQDLEVEGSTFRMLSEPFELVGPGESRHVAIEYQSSAEADESGALRFYTSDPDRFEQVVPLSGIGTSSGLLVYPRVLQFENVTIGCGANARATVHNPSDIDREVTIGFELGSDPAFSLSSVNSGIVPARAAVDVEVRFGPSAVEQDLGALVIRETNGASYVVSLAGSGSVDGGSEERFERSSNAIDVLFVIDSSGSTFEEQAALGDSFGTLIPASTALDYQLGFVSMDADVCPDTADPPANWWGAGTCGYLSEGNPNGGMVVPDWRIIAPDESPSPAEAFASQVRLGGAGSGSEQGFEVARRALSAPIITGWNSGFMRRDADLAVVFLSDEPEQSPLPVSYYRDWIRALKGFDERERVTVSAFVGDVPNGCTSSDGNAQSGARYVELLEATAGGFESICGRNWADKASRIGFVFAGLRSRLFLDAQPEPATIAVEVEGQEAPFAYDAATNSIAITGGIPIGDAAVSVRYRTACQ